MYESVYIYVYVNVYTSIYMTNLQLLGLLQQPEQLRGQAWPDSIAFVAAGTSCHIWPT